MGSNPTLSANRTTKLLKQGAFLLLIERRIYSRPYALIRLRAEALGQLSRV